MTEEIDIIPILLKTLRKLNQQLPAERHIKISPDTILFGNRGELDSLGLVTLIILVEEQIADELGVEVTIADEKAMSLKNSPFRSVNTLSDYVGQILRKKQNA